MNTYNFPADEEYDKQCGEIFLTIKGELLIHCTLCETRYKGFLDYADHVNDTHYNPFEDLPNFSDEEEYVLPTKKENDSDLYTEKLEDNQDNDVQSRTSVEQEEFLSEPEVVEINLEEEERQMELELDKTKMVEEEIEINFLEKVQNGFQEEFLKKTQTDYKSSEPPKKYRFMAGKKGRPKKNDTGKKERKHHCPHCGFSCTERSNLVGHIQRHSYYKPHQCHITSECSKAFYTRTELNTHILIHTGERPFLCPDCGQGFTTSSKLNAHRKRHSNLRDRECNLCHMKFFDLNALKQHLSVHSEDRPYKCKLCPSRFKLYSSLVSHNKCHINARQYRCDICPKRFNQKCNLNVHRNSIHGVSLDKAID